MTMDCNKINIKNGNTGTEVKQLQKYLKYYKYYTGNIDGNCGTLTTNAIKAYQQDKKLVVDGIFGTISCKTSNINGMDISLTQNTIPLTQWQDMINRYNQYTKEHNNNEPKIIYIDKENPYEYITLTKYKEIKNRYDQYIKEHNTQPNFMYINKTTITTTPNNTTKTNINTTNTTTNYNIFTNTYLCEKQVPDCAGQITGYHCACHCIKQALRRFGITKYTEQTIGGYAGTTTAGTSHQGIETALAKIAKNEGIQLQVEWKNFSDLGTTNKERWKRYGDLMTDNNKAVFHHELYRNKYGHYSLLKQVNTITSTLIVQNSLGSRYGSGYAGYMENRSTSTQEQYLKGISQKSICIITKK